MTLTRRDFIRQAGKMGVGLVSVGLAPWAFGAEKAIPHHVSHQPPQEPEEEVSPVEDLMREHDIVERLLLIFEESARQLAGNRDGSPDILAAALRINRDFVEDYHEKLEEKYLFPRLKHAGIQVALVETLLAQHRAGRQLTDAMLHAVSGYSFKNSEKSQTLILSIHEYSRMYRPHAAREDTVLFPAFKTIVPAHEYDALGEQFEDEEHRLFGKAGFEGVVAQIAQLEQQLGIQDLNQFTPSVSEHA